MKRYGTDLEKEYNGIVKRIKKRFNFLNHKTGKEFASAREYNTDVLIDLIKYMEKKYVEETNQTDLFE